jgi:glyoxylate reductase
MALPRVFVTRAIPEPGLALLRAGVDLEVWLGELPPPYEALRKKAASVDGLLTLVTDRIDADLLGGAPRLKVVSQMAVGTDNIDLAAAVARRLPVGHTPGVLTETTADFAWALLLAVARRVVEADHYTRAGGWKTWGPMLMLGPDVSGATLGLIGFGRIGQAVARRARGFDMRVLYYDRQRRPEAESALGAIYTELDDLYSQSDFISLHTSLNAATHHLVGDAAFARMKPGAMLVNTSRGSVVDPRALYRALAGRRLAGAALDVTDPEPLPLDSPLLQLDNLIIAPHIASASFQTRGKMASMAADNLLAGLAGRRVPHCANPQVYDL